MKLFRRKHGYTIITNDSIANEIIQRFADEYSVKGEKINVYKQDEYYIITFITNEKCGRIRNLIRIIFKDWKYDLCFKENIIGIIKKETLKDLFKKS